MALKNSIDQPIEEEWEKQSSGQSSGQSENSVQNFVQNPDRPKHWIEVYPKKTKHYYRYVWREKGKLHHLHIPGGNTTNPNAIALKEKVESAIAQGMTPHRIVQLIRGNKM